jgi:hypothetical protein
LANRVVEFIDIAYDEVAAKHYKEEEVSLSVAKFHNCNICVSF